MSHSPLYQIIIIFALLLLIFIIIGTFNECVEQSNGSALELLKLIVNDFACFRDEYIFKDEKGKLRNLKGFNNVHIVLKFIFQFDKVDFFPFNFEIQFHFTKEHK